mgnify:CR=1 FL=1
MSKKTLDKAIGFMNVYGKVAILVAAIFPLPYVPMIIGALGVNPRNFSLFGLLPRAVGLATFGYLFSLGIL